MMHDPFPPRDEWHSATCRCPACAPERTEQATGLSANTIAVLAIAGIAFGQVLAFILDRLVDGPGVFAIFGF